MILFSRSVFSRNMHIESVTPHKAVRPQCGAGGHLCVSACQRHATDNAFVIAISVRDVAFFAKVNHFVDVSKMITQRFEIISNQQ